MINGCKTSLQNQVTGMDINYIVVVEHIYTFQTNINYLLIDYNLVQ